jgi:mono/diheme cytochrome c family protein
MNARFPRLRKSAKRTTIAVIVFVVIVAAGNYGHFRWEFRDQDPDRGATADSMNRADAMGDSFSKVVYTNQGWDASQSLWFYTTTQGSDLLPYDFFLELEQPGSQELFRAAANLNKYRYLVQKPTPSNPDGLPVGMVKDRYQGEADRVGTYMGFTCAACHTSQVNVNGTAIRIDGGPSAADMVGFMEGLAKALQATREDADKRQRFVKTVLARGNYDSDTEVLKDLDTYTLRVSMYNVTNRSATPYGYARLDAFGRIYNRVLEHLLTKQQLAALVASIPGLSTEQVKYIMDGAPGILSAEGREEITRRTLEALKSNHHSEAGALKEVIKYLRDPVFNHPNAPVSYPFLWDIAQHDYVQWNGIGANAGVGPLGRNVGEVIGVFGTLDWHATDQCRTAEKITGQCTLLGKPTNGKLVRFESSVDMRNLRKIEEQLASLMSPRWDDDNLKDVLPPLNQPLVERGGELFDRYCIACHQEIDSRDPNRKVVAFMNDYKKVGTDPQMVENSVGYQGKAGFLKDLYVGAGDSNLVIQEQMPVAALLTLSTTAVVATADPDESWLYSRLSWLFDLYKSYTNNRIKPSLKQGDYPLATTQNPYASLQAYKGRPLNGIWATAPYLHNGSVPTLYHLLLPAECPSSTPDCEKRPTEFLVGSRELNTAYVGFKYEGYEGFRFLTSLKANSNKGHEYGTLDTVLADGTKLPALGHEERMALVEYMKSL